METVVGVVIGVVAALCWVSAVVHWIWMLGHRRPEISLATLLFAGYKSYDATNFLPSGQKIHRRFLYSIGGFFLAIVIGIVLTTVLRSRH
jgi:hypothetical protein